MPELKPCIHRGKEVVPGLHICVSNRIQHQIPRLAPTETCEICPYFDKKNLTSKELPDDVKPPPLYRRLGDLVFDSLKITGIGWLAEKVMKWLDINCNCPARRQWMNEIGWTGLFRYFLHRVIKGVKRCLRLSK